MGAVRRLRLREVERVSWILDRLSRLVTAKPAATLVVLLAATIGLGSGMTRLAPQADTTVFLPEDSEVAAASDTIDTLFGGIEETVTVRLIFRGDTLTAAGLAQIDATVGQAVGHPEVEPLLVQQRPVLSPAQLIAGPLGTSDFASATQQAIDEAAAQIPVDRLVGTDTDGSGVALATVRLVTDVDRDGDTDDDEAALERAELAIGDLAAASQGPLAATTLSPAVIAGESSAATGSEMLVLIGLALLVIAALLLAFTRSLLDVLLSLLGLVLTVVWVMGAQGWLGPEGLELMGAPNTITTMVPIMLIGLVVDYAIQTVALYREQRGVGHDASTSARLGLRAVIIPLSLAAVTTIVSFLSNLTSPIPANGDFGIAAGVGVAAGLIVMLVLLSAARALHDRRREAGGKLKPPRAISGSIPGVGRAVEALGGQLARRPAPYLVVVGLVTVLLGLASTRIETVFDSSDFLPSGGDALRSIETLDAAFGGSTDTVKVLIEAEITDDRSVRNVLDFTAAFDDDLRRPEGVVGGIQSSLGSLLLDWISDDGTAGDNYDPELVALAAAANDFRLSPAQAQAVIDRLEQVDPAGFSRVAVDDPDGPDALLIQFEALTGDRERAERMVADIDGLWYGDDEQLAITSSEVMSIEVVNAMTGSQTASIMTTILAALIILTLFFWITKGRPSHGFIAVGPVVLVLIWVLGTMALLDIPYNVITAMITALSIGIGVDYTIHIIHRYDEEFSRSRDPEAAARRTLATTGSALLGSALTTALGFGVLMMSSLPPFQQFGIVTAITISYALIAAIVVVPPSMILWAAYQNHRLRTAAALTGQRLVEAEPGPSDS